MNAKTRRRHSRRRNFLRRTGPGSSPGTLVADPLSRSPSIQLIAYGADEVVECTVDDPQQVRTHLGRWPVVWINVDGLGDASVVATLGEILGLHRLAQEDVLNAHQRPKVEYYDAYYFIVARTMSPGDAVGSEQLSMFLGNNYVLTFQEMPGACFDPVRQRIRKKDGRIRQAGPDYLAYALLDAVIDGFFPVLENYGERLETLEDEVLIRPDARTMPRVHQAKRDLLSLRKVIWPMREAINSLVRDSTTLISADTRIYLRDCYDHTIQIIDILEGFRDVSGSLVEVYLSSVSNRMNEIMKVLTIFSTIFIPLTFIAGIYGMNFNTGMSPVNMPELNWAWGYPFSLALMVLVAGIMLAYFRRKGWILAGQPISSPGERPSPQEPETRRPAE